MSDRHQPEPWQTDALGPFLTIETPRVPVALHSLGNDRFRLTGLGVEREITRPCGGAGCGGRARGGISLTNG